MMEVTLPSFETYNDVIDQLTQSLKYVKFSEWVFDLLQRFLEMLAKLFNRSVPNINFSAGEGSISARIILVIICIIIVALLFFFTYKFLKGRSKRKKLKSILGETITEESTVQGFREKSKKYEHNKNYRLALRMQFIAILLHLHQQNILYQDDSMTVKEMITILKTANFSAFQNFCIIANQFNHIWYGEEELDKEAYKHIQYVEETFWKETL